MKDEAAAKNLRDFEINKRKRRMQKREMDNPLLLELREQFINEIVEIGFDREDVEIVLNVKGLYALDKSLVIE